jgi:hypothetical protein
MSSVGFIWRIEWGNPYTDPPNGLPRILAEIYVTKSYDGEGAREPASLKPIMPPLGCGFCVSVRAINKPLKPISKEAKVSLRKKKLKKRMEKKYPLFADQFAAEVMQLKRDYYSGNDDDQHRDAVLHSAAVEFEKLTSNPNHLFVYGQYLGVENEKEKCCNEKAA